MNKKISVIMCTYDEPLRYIQESTKSILNQTYTNFEFIIIVDNPQRKDIIQYLKGESKNDKRIKLYVNPKNIGLTASLNRGIDIASSDYIARMDADDISNKHRLDKQLKYITEHKLDLIGSYIINIDSTGREHEKPTLFPKDDQTIKKFLRYNSPISHPTWFGKTELFKTNKYIDFPACEDYEFLVRAAFQGKKLGNINEVLLQYRIDSNGISNNKRAIQKTTLAYIRKNYRKDKLSNYHDLDKYIKSARGQRKHKHLQRYYSTLENVREYRAKRSYLKFISSFCILLLNPVAIETLYCSMRSKQLRKR